MGALQIGIIRDAALLPALVWHSFACREVESVWGIGFLMLFPQVWFLRTAYQALQDGNWSGDGWDTTRQLRPWLRGTRASGRLSGRNLRVIAAHLREWTREIGRFGTNLIDQWTDWPKGSMQMGHIGEFSCYMQPCYHLMSIHLQGVLAAAPAPFNARLV